MQPSVKTNKFSSLLKNEVLHVAVLWAFFETLWYAVFGVHFKLEAEKYIGEAHYILNNQSLSQTRFIFYFSTIAVIAFSFALNAGVYGALFLILAINLFSYICFYKALKQLFHHWLSPYLVVAALLSFWPYQSWSFYLYTECLFYSGVLLLFAHLMLYRQLTFKFLGITFLLLLFLIISRPLGILFVLPALLFIFFKLSKKQKFIFFIAATGFAVTLNYVVQIVFTTTSDWSMARALTDSSIICDMPRASAGSTLHLSQHPNQLYQLFYYLLHNFAHFAGVALVRLKYFFTLTRSYYSTAHNMYLVAHLLLIYGSIVFGIKQIARSVPYNLRVFIFSAILLFSIAIAVQCDDYHNRFFLTLMPFFVTLAALALLPVLYRLPFFKKNL